MTSNTSVCWRPGIMTHSSPPSTVVDLQTTTCVGTASDSVLDQSQVTRLWSWEQQCHSQAKICSHTRTSWYVNYTKLLHQCGIMVENMLHIQVDFAGVLVYSPRKIVHVLYSAYKQVRLPWCFIIISMSVYMHGIYQEDMETKLWLVTRVGPNC